MRGADKYAVVRLAITDVFERNHSCYGYRRLRASLGRQHVFISEEVMRRLMKQEGLIVALRSGVGMAPTWEKSAQR